MICVNWVFAALCSFVPLCFPSLASFTCGLVLSLGPFRYPCRRYVQVALPLVPGWFLFNCRLVAAGCCGRRTSDVLFSTLNIIMKSTFERTPPSWLMVTMEEINGTKKHNRRINFT